MNSRLWYQFKIVFLTLSFVAMSSVSSGLFAEGASPDEQQRGLKKKRSQTLQSDDLNTQQKNDLTIVPVLPKVPTGADDVNQLSVAGSIHVKKIKFTGNTILSPIILQQFAKPYEGKNVTIEQLNQLRHDLSRYYLQKGYINSGVRIPDQKIANGVVTLEIIEGRLTQIEVEGLQRLNRNHIVNRIPIEYHQILNLNDLSDKMKLLNRDPLIKQINAKLLPGEKLGESILKLRIVEDNAFYYSVAVDNYLPPSVGSERFVLGMGHSNLLGFSDRLGFNFELSEGLTGVNGSYDFPVTSGDSRLGVYAEYSDYVAVEAPFDQIDIESESNTVGISYGVPVIHTLDEDLAASVTLEKRHNESTLLGEPFSFALGSILGEMDLTVLGLSLDWVSRKPTQVFSVFGTLRIGLNALDATENNGDIPDGEFSLIRVNAQYGQLLPFWNSQLQLRTGFQYTPDNLLALEKYSIGGRYSVRGYRENQFVRDNGIALTLEWRQPLISNANKMNNLFLTPFYDFGSSWNNDDQLTQTERQSISSVGLGLLWDYGQHLHMELFYSYALKDLPDPQKKIYRMMVFIFRSVTRVDKLIYALMLDVVRM